MSKEELERASVQGLSSSVPPQRKSDAPVTLPSTPPSTDDIDTDWGADDDSSEVAPDWVADDSNEVTRVMQHPLRVQFAPSTGSEPPPALVAAPVAEAAPEAPTSPTASPAPPEANVEGNLPPMRPAAETLIGLPAPTPPTEAESESQADDSRDSMPPPMPSAAYSEPVRAPSIPPPPLASPSAAPPPLAPPSAPPPPIAAPSSPPPPIAASSSPPPPIAASSAPPPPIATPSARPPATHSTPPPIGATSNSPSAHPSAPPAQSSVPAPRVLSATPEAAPTSATAGPSGFGRWLLVLAAGLVVVCILGYRVLRRNQAALAQSEASAPLEPAATSTATVAAEPAAPPPAAEVVAADAAPGPAASGSAASAEAEESAPAAPASDAPPSPAASGSAASAQGAEGKLSKVTVKSRPPKVRFFHFGKLVGVTPFVLELKPGERHAYEAGLPGYNTRKVVIDGSKPQIIVGLTREKP